jgi:hypothetical protein
MLGPELLRKASNGKKQLQVGRHAVAATFVCLAATAAGWAACCHSTVALVSVLGHLQLQVGQHAVAVVSVLKHLLYRLLPLV